MSASPDRQLGPTLDLLESQKAQCERALAGLFVGSLTKRVVKGHAYYYLVRRGNGKVLTTYKGKLTTDELARYAHMKRNRDAYRRQLALVEDAIRALERVIREPLPEGADAPAGAGADVMPGGRRVSDIHGRVDRARVRRPGANQGRMVRRAKPVVLLYGSISRRACVDLAHGWGWDLLDLELTEEIIPRGVTPAGLITDKLPMHPVEVTLPTLSSVDTAREASARRAMVLLRSLIDGESKPDAPILIPPAGIVERQSTDLLAVADPALALALRFMWDHLEQNISVGDIAEAAGVGRRRLERAFRGELGRSVNAELRRKRLEQCCHLLKTTDLPVADVAPLTGFCSAGYLNKVFRQAFGTTPRKWRVASTAPS